MNRRFQLYVLAIILLTVLIELSVWVLVPSHGAKFDNLILDGYRNFVGTDFVTYTVFLSSHVAFLIGLYKFHPSARRLYLFYVSLIFAVAALFELRLIPFFGMPVSSLLWLFDVAILVLAYASPARAEFKVRAA
jgi:hypothetical protein